MRYIYKHIAIIIALLFIPVLAKALIIVGPPTPTFENVQNLVLSAQAIPTGASSTPIIDQGSLSIPLKASVSISYQITHTPFWPSDSASPNAEDALFTQKLSQNQVYLDLWEGTPFTPTAHMIKTWDITNAPIGQISATFSDAGPYFLIAYFPSGFYQNPQSMCPGDANWKVDCASLYTLDQMRGYFNTSLASTSSQFFPYKPDAFGGVQFKVNSSVSPLLTSNVLFLPGIEGSRLYMRDAFGVEKNLWEPSILNTIPNLTLNADGSSQHEIYTRDLVDYPYGIKTFGEVYGPFENFMDRLVTGGVITKWEAFPYDWRYDVADIVDNGTLVANSTGPISRIYLQDVAQELASTSPTGRVTIIAHSNGGLLARALAIKLQSENKLHLIDQIIFIGSPQLGTPLSIGALLNGDGQTDAAGGLLMYGGTVRAAASTMPGMYGLLPSATYFSRAVDAPILFTGNTGTNVYEKYFGSQINSAASLGNFLSDAYHLDSDFSSNDLRTPLPLSSSLITKEATTHVQLDAWIPPPGLTVSEISGWGNLTPYQYLYSNSNTKKLSCFQTGFLTVDCDYAYRVQHTVVNTDDGDNTVVLSSANINPHDNFYFNAKAYGADELGIIGHGNLTSAAPIQAVIKNLLAHTSTNVPYISSSVPTGGLNPLTVISAHSPVNIVATDANGNQTGIFPIPGKPDIYFQKESIPGSSLQVLDDEKYVYLPEHEQYSISLNGYAGGETTLDIGTMNTQGITNNTEEFENIPTTASTAAEFSLRSSWPESASTSLPVPELHVDVFGNGSTMKIEGVPATQADATSSSPAGPDCRFLLLWKELLLAVNGHQLLPLSAERCRFRIL